MSKLPARERDHSTFTRAKGCSVTQIGWLSAIAKSQCLLRQSYCVVPQSTLQNNTENKQTNNCTNLLPPCEFRPFLLGPPSVGLEQNRTTSKSKTHCASSKDLTNCTCGSVTQHSWLSPLTKFGSSSLVTSEAERDQQHGLLLHVVSVNTIKPLENQSEAPPSNRGAVLIADHRLHVVTCFACCIDLLPRRNIKHTLLSPILV